jgi:hypothetical protein
MVIVYYDLETTVLVDVTLVALAKGDILPLLNGLHDVDTCFP